MEMKIKNTTLNLITGDITEMDTDAIVNAANNHLWMGGGVAGAIKRRGGQEIEAEAVKQGPVPVGEAVITKGGRLKAKYVIHAAGMGTDLKTDEIKIQTATLNSLKRAEEKALKSVAFPSIGTGVGGFPVSKAAEAMLGTVQEYLSDTNSKLEIIIFVLYNPEIYLKFENVAVRLFQS
jgi:O-acetyl-ADP-ribose deacetylase (regulator of RNase III)